MTTIDDIKSAIRLGSYTIESIALACHCDYQTAYNIICDAIASGDLSCDDVVAPEVE